MVNLSSNREYPSHDEDRYEGVETTCYCNPGNREIRSVLCVETRIRECTLDDRENGKCCKILSGYLSLPNIILISSPMEARNNKINGRATQNEFQTM